jgi:DNA-binding CsgD family transcriptional regulator
MDSATRELGMVAEMALAAADLHAFEREWFDCLQRSLGFESACSVWTDERGATRSVSVIGYAESMLAEHFSRYMSELTVEEVAGFSSETPALDLDVITSRRRERLTVYTELLIPERVSCFVTNVWNSRWGAFGFHLARCSRSASFTPRDLARLSRLLPALKLGTTLHAANQLRTGSPVAFWEHAWELSPRERDIARLAARGLSNPEIAGLLRISRHTVRNHLASVFLKAAVSTRAELAFAMSCDGALAEESEQARRSTRGAWSAFLARGSGR